MLFYAETPLKFAFSKRLIGEEEASLKVQDSQKVFSILGVPFDGTSTYQPGARFGPMLLRESSYNFEGYNLYLDKNWIQSSMTWEMCRPFLATSKTCHQVQFSVQELVDHGYVPLVIGGPQHKLPCYPGS